MNTVESRIVAIEKRNAKVEKDKAWETSLTRRVSIATLTYVVVVLFLFAIGNDMPFINGLVPVMGFVLSTLAMDWVRMLWERKQ